ncbi:MAG: alpha/beta fold hydrolase [Variovorax sp.]|nr:MAG: alpha/beta fold hydrolase [Variovorax sp.]
MQIQIRHDETLSINYAVAGEGQDIVLVHGLGLSSMKTWTHQVPTLAKHFRVHTYDVRGFGQTDNPAGKFSVQQHAYDLHALLKTLGLKQVILVGFSMGGWIAQQFTLDHPEMVRALVLSCTTSGLRPEGATRFVDRAAKVESLGTAPLAEEQIRNTFAPESMAEQPELIDFYRENFLNTQENDPVSYAAMFRALTVPHWTAQLGRITCPTLVVCGDADKGITRGNTPTDAAEILHQGVPGSRLEVIAQGGHYAHLERPEEWNAMLKNFIDTVAA